MLEHCALPDPFCLSRGLLPYPPQFLGPLGHCPRGASWAPYTPEMSRSTPWLCAAHSQVLVSELRAGTAAACCQKLPLDARQTPEAAYPERSATLHPKPVPPALLPFLRIVATCHPIPQTGRY
ncbi:unnamed protein product [Rangifer tarandus platyrhynchus]|uniref:Uncharacterized protein n=1 Tax=Rangifer tarandus platyrhynchus TaxID=3082113 RepID=A0AC59YSP3_RANTA